MLSTSIALANSLLNKIDENLADTPPTSIIVSTLAAVGMIYSVNKLSNAITQIRSMTTRQIQLAFLDKVITNAERLPFVGPKITALIDKELAKEFAPTRAKVHAERATKDLIRALPNEGLDPTKVFMHCTDMGAKHKHGHLSGAEYSVYNQTETDVLKHIFESAQAVNPLHSSWPGINRMEAELISICAKLFHAPEDTYGLVTHGGSTSIFEACSAYVLDARRKGILQPEIIISSSTHTAFNKAAELLNAKLIIIPVTKTGGADVKKIEAAISKNTCLIVGSAPSYPHGIIDPISALASLAKKKHIGLHVDACLGGFLLAFADREKFPLPDFDFILDGVTSMSMDTHKYGQAIKGNSILLFRKNAPTPTYTNLYWTGGAYITPGLDGSRSALPIVMSLAMLLLRGKDRFREETTQILSLQQECVKRINELDDVFIPYPSNTSVIGIHTRNDINSLVVANHLEKQGWSVNLLQTENQQPDGFHFCLTAVHTHRKGFVDEFINALQAAISYAKANPKIKPEGNAKVYGLLQTGLYPPRITSQIGVNYTKINNSLPRDPEENNKKPFSLG